MKNKKINLNDKNKELCDGCSDCCNYIAVQIDKPTAKKDFDNIIWFLLHKNVYVYIDFENDWYLEFITPCEALDDKTKLCADYENRPQVCRNYSQKDCTHYNNEPAEKKYFKTVGEFKKYLKGKKINYSFK